MKKLSIYVAVAMIPLGLWAQSEQTVTLRNGTQITGTVVKNDNGQVTIRDRDGNTRRVSADEVRSIDYTRNNGDFNNRDTNNDRDRFDRSSNQQRDRLDRSNMTVPAGSDLTIRTNENIDSRDATDSRSYAAQVDRDVLDNSGNVVIPRGSEARLVVRRVGNSELALDLQSLRVSGQSYNIDSEAISRGREGIGKNRRTGEYVGGGAALGAIIGAIAGGGKGAAIGAIAGGGAGAGAQVLTRGDHVSVPAEATLNFRLESPLILNAVR